MRLFQALCVCIPLVVLVAPGWAAGQDEADIVPEIWLDYNPSYALSPKVLGIGSRTAHRCVKRIVNTGGLI